MAHWSRETDGQRPVGISCWCSAQLWSFEELQTIVKFHFAQGKCSDSRGKGEAVVFSEFVDACQRTLILERAHKNEALKAYAFSSPSVVTVGAIPPCSFFDASANWIFIFLTWIICLPRLKATTETHRDDEMAGVCFYEAMNTIYQVCGR